MQEASGVDFTDLFWSACLPSIFDPATVAPRNILAAPHSRSAFNRRPHARPAWSCPRRAVPRRDGRPVFAILCGSLARRRVVLAEI
jgi:hypothetical protein